ncbi:MAG TPA: UDP-N-acetylmuramoyl-tripeptide--D-alanyl-D-alanine ligase [Parasegetibacter sp.]
MTITELYNIYQQYPGVQTDTRKLQKGDLFFALKGPNFNANTLAAKAIEAGAAFAIIDDAQYHHPPHTILVDDVLQTLQDLAKHHRQQFKIPFLAVTGTNGKTTTKELIYQVLSSHKKTYTTKGNLNNHIGVPLTLLSIKADAEIAVIEMGANHQGEIASYCVYALPTHGLITNCGKAHLEGFGGEEGVRKGKGELFDFLRANGGTAFIMNDYAYLREMSKGIPNIITYGTTSSEFTGSVSNSDPYLKAKVMIRGKEYDIDTQLVGDYNLPNILAAVAVGTYFDIPVEKQLKALVEYSPANSRSQLVHKGSNTIIMDAYNANPTSMKVALENFAKLKAENKLVMLGAMMELGASSNEEHQKVVKMLNNLGFEDVVLVGGDFRGNNKNYIYLDNSQAAAEWLKSLQLKNTTILVKGSRSIEMERLLEAF